MNNLLGFERLKFVKIAYFIDPSKLSIFSGTERVKIGVKISKIWNMELFK